MALQDKGKLAAAQANREVGTQPPAPQGLSWSPLWGCQHLHYACLDLPCREVGLGAGFSTDFLASCPPCPIVTTCPPSASPMLSQVS